MTYLERQDLIRRALLIAEDSEDAHAVDIIRDLVDLIEELKDDGHQQYLDGVHVGRMVDLYGR